MLEFFTMQWKASKIANVDSWFDFWDKSDPYIKFLKIRNDNSYVEVHRTEIIKDDLNPIWKSFEVQAARLINPNKQAFR
jgi:hypothetical protein